MVFRIFENLLERHATGKYTLGRIKDFLKSVFNVVCIALKAINNEFVYGFAQAMDGEKDPRNLMCAFKLVKDIIDNFDISAHVEVRCKGGWSHHVAVAY